MPKKTKPLPPCAQSFLKGRISGDPAKIRLHDGGGGGGGGGGPTRTPGPSRPPTSTPEVVVVKERPKKRTVRRLNTDERRILSCNGASQAALDSVSIAGTLPPWAYLDPGTDGQTLPGVIPGRSTIHLRGGNGNMVESQGQLSLMAHEFAHHMQFRQGVGLLSYFREWAKVGYTNNFYEMTARDFSREVVDNYRSGSCR